MSQSLTQIYLHVIFSTKARTPYFNDRELRSRVHAYLAGICHNFESPSLLVGGVEDHVHLLCRLAKTSTTADLLRELKRESSKWIKSLTADLTTFSWQGGYGAFSISPGHVEPLKRYIADQEAHHRQENFQDEFRRICAHYGVALDERYVWE